MSKIGAALNTLQVKAEQLAELINTSEVEGERDPGDVLKAVRLRVHELNEAYFRYAQEVWGMKQLELTVVVE